MFSKERYKLPSGVRVSLKNLLGNFETFEKQNIRFSKRNLERIIELCRSLNCNLEENIIITDSSFNCKCISTIDKPGQEVNVLVGKTVSVIVDHFFGKQTRDMREHCNSTGRRN